MTAIADLPDIRPSLLLDFANSGRVDPRIECTRASSATCFGPDGKLRTVAANVPRIDYDPATGKCLGLLVEEARTNLAYPSNMPTSTVQTTTGVMQANGGTKITSGVLAPDGAYTGFTVSGADTNVNANGNNNIRAIGALPKIGNYAISFWIKTKAGSPSANVIVRVPTATGTSPQFSTTETWKRISLVATTTAGNDGVIIYSWGGVAFDMWGLQIEEGSFPTSYIPTAGTTATRAADSVGLDLPRGMHKGSAVLNETRIGSSSNGHCFPMFLGTDATGFISDYIGAPYVRQGSTAATRSVYIRAEILGPESYSLTTSGAGNEYGVMHKTAISWTKGRLAISFNNGGTAFSEITEAELPLFRRLTFSRKFANYDTSAAGATVIHRLYFYSTVVSDTQLKRLTA